MKQKNGVEDGTGMEDTANAFIESQKKKKKRKRVRNIIALCVVAVLLAGGGLFLVRVLNAASAEVSVRTYTANRVSEGEISATISGSGTLSARHTQTVTSGAAATVEQVFYQPGDAVPEGGVIATLSSDEVQEQLDTLNEQLDDARTELAGTKQALSNLNVTATKAGVVKDVQATAGDAAEDLPYLCLISTDGKMKVVIDAPDGLKKYDAVRVSVEGAESVEGSVTALLDGKATVVFDDDGYSVGAGAAVTDESGAALGSGTLEVNEHVKITATAGRIDAVKYGVENKSVSRGTVLFTLASGAPTSAYVTLKETEADLLEQIAELEQQLTVTAEWDCIVASLPISEGDELAAGGTVCVLSGTDGYTMTLSIDELDISTVALGQTATVTLDALEGTFAGTVSDISYAGSGSYVTSYTVTVTTDPIEGALPGMSASVEIVTETSGQTLIVPVDALYYDGDTAYLYLAGEDATYGASVNESALDLTALTRVDVETGMSNGTYIAISAEGLSAGDLIWVPKLTTTAAYTADEETAVSFGMGGGMQSGGQMPSGGFGGEMPSGGMPSGGYGGDRGSRSGS